MYKDVLDGCSFVPFQGAGKRRRLDELRPSADDGHDLHCVPCPVLCLSRLTGQLVESS